MVSLDYSYRRLINILGPERVSRSWQERVMYNHDVAMLPKLIRLQWRVEPDFIVLPKTTKEVQRLVEFSYEAGLPIVPRGAGTGLVGGAVPNRGGILMDLSRMDKIVDLDTDNRTVTVEGGAKWKDLAEVAERAGLFLPVYPAGAPGSTVGGVLAGSGLGIGSAKFGSVRNFVFDLEVVLPNGDALHTADPAVDLGPAWANATPLFLGSEGTCGIVTRARVQLLPCAEELRPLAYSFPDLWAARDVPAALGQSDAEPYHVGISSSTHAAYLAALHRVEADPRSVAIVALEGPKDEMAEREKTVDAEMAGVGGTKESADIARNAWDGRFVRYPARRLSKGLVATEVVVPTKSWPLFLKKGAAWAKRLKVSPAFIAYLAGRMSVGVNAYFLESQDNPGPLRSASVGYVKKLGDSAIEVGGHPLGFGMFLAYNLYPVHRNASELVHAIKRTLDPHLKINPGKTTEVWTKFRWPFIRSIPPRAMALGLDAAAFVRRFKLRADRPPGGVG